MFYKRYILFIFYLVLLAFVQSGFCSESLQTKIQDISLKVGETKPIGVYLSSPLNFSVEIFAHVDDPSVLTVVPKIVNISANSIETIVFNLTAINAGHGNVSFNASPEIDTMSAFARVNVFHSFPLVIFSSIVGWLYFVAWSVSFYPQAFTNWKRKSVVGLNFDFLALNLSGFLAYSIYNTAFYFLTSVHDEYKELNPQGVIPIEINDVVFAIHALFATVLTVIQCFIYERGDQKVSKMAIVFLILGWGGGLLFFFLDLFGAIQQQPWLNLLYYFSYFKLVITIIKYMPQAYFNFRRKSTVGWSIGNILLDFTGGMLSILQMFIIAYNYDDWHSIFGNPAKLGLGLVSIIFDLFFMWQHYVLYRGKGEVGPSTSLLSKEPSSETN